MDGEQKIIETQIRENVHKGRRHQTAGWFQKVVEKITRIRETQVEKETQEMEGKAPSKMENIEQNVDTG